MEYYKIKSYVLPLPVLILLLAAASIFCSCQVADIPPRAKNGVLDARSWDFSSQGGIELKGEWKFVWQQDEEQFKQPDYDDSTWQNFKVPGYWNHIAGQGQGYGWFRLRLKLASATWKRIQQYGFFLKHVHSTYTLYINGRKFMSDGVFGQDRTTSTPIYQVRQKSLAKLFYTQPQPKENQSSELVLALRISNFHHARGGIWQAPRLDIFQRLERERQLDEIIDAMVVGILLVMAIYHLLLYYLRRQDVASLYFSLLCLSLSCYLIAYHPFGNILFSLSTWRFNLGYFSIQLAILSLCYFIYHLFPSPVVGRVNRFVLGFFLVCTSIIFITEPLFFTAYVLVNETGAALAVVWCLSVSVRAMVKKREGAIIVFIGLLVGPILVLNDILHTQQVITSQLSAPFGFLFFIFTQSLVLSNLFAKAHRRKEQLGEQLQQKIREQSTELNRHRIRLEQLVEKRTNMLNQTSTRLKDELQERRQAEDELRISEQKHYHLLEAIPDVVYEIDEQGNILYMNRIAEEVFLCPLDRLVGEDIRQLILAEDRNLFTRRFNLPEQESKKTGMMTEQKVCGSKKNLELEVDLKLRLKVIGDLTEEDKKAGIKKPEFIHGEIKAVGSYSSKREDGLKIFRSVGIIRDITNRKKMEQEVKRAYQIESVGVLAGGIAHDFNNYLQSIMGNTQLAKMISSTNEDIVKMLDETMLAAHYAKDLSQQLLTFSKGGLPLKREISLFLFLKDAANFAASGSKTKCTFNLNNDLWEVMGDQNQLQQVIHNLVLNAQQAMPDGGTVEIEAINYIKDENSRIPLSGKYNVMVSVIDSGVGIPEKIRDKIFFPFFTTKQSGRGLGLTVAQSIIKNHSGFLTIESSSGEGSTFRFYLPALVSADQNS